MRIKFRLNGQNIYRFIQYQEAKSQHNMHQLVRIEVKALRIYKSERKEQAT